MDCVLFLWTQISVVHPELLTETGCALPEKTVTYSEDRKIIRRPIIRIRLSGHEDPSYRRDVARLTCADNLRVTRDHALRPECQLRQGRRETVLEEYLCRDDLAQPKR